MLQNGTTDANGTYQFLEVHVGRYRVTAEATGFKKTETAEFRVDTGSQQRVDVSLQVGDASQIVDVASAATPLQTESSDRGEVNPSKGEVFTVSGTCWGDYVKANGFASRT